MPTNGTICVFAYPTVFVTLPEYTRRAGQLVTVLRPLAADEAGGPLHGGEQMYKVRTADGMELDAFESELQPTA